MIAEEAKIMRTAKIGMWLAVFLGNLFGAQQLEIKTLSGKPDMVSGGSALIEISGAPVEGFRVLLNGKDVTQAFRAVRT